MADESFSRPTEDAALWTMAIENHVKGIIQRNPSLLADAGTFGNVDNRAKLTEDLGRVISVRDVPLPKRGNGPFQLGDALRALNLRVD